jgi:hypothetical protein
MMILPRTILSFFLFIVACVEAILWTVLTPDWRKPSLICIPDLCLKHDARGDGSSNE